MKEPRNGTAAEGATERKRGHVSHRVFLLSPGSLRGKWAELPLDQGSDIPLARSLRSRDGGPLGELFAFTSSLYFRGKRTYARKFASPPPGLTGLGDDHPSVQVDRSSKGVLGDETLNHRWMLQTWWTRTKRPRARQRGRQRGMHP